MKKEVSLASLITEDRIISLNGSCLDFLKTLPVGILINSDDNLIIDYTGNKNRSEIKVYPEKHEVSYSCPIKKLDANYFLIYRKNEEDSNLRKMIITDNISGSSFSVEFYPRNIK